MKLILLIIGLMLLIGTASATDYYVSPTGNDANGGQSIGDAWLTLNKASDTMVAGDTTYVVDGNYPVTNDINFVNSGNSTHPINLVAYNGTPYITGTIADGILTFGSQQYINVSGFEFFSSRRKILVTGSNNTVHNNTLSGSNNGNTIHIAAGTSYITVDSCTFYNQSGGENMMDINSNWGTGKITHHINITNNLIYNVTNHNGFNFRGDSDNFSEKAMHNVTVTNNTMYEVRGGIAMATNYIYMFDCNISDNEVYDSDTGISLYLRDSLVERNYVHSVSSVPLGTNDKWIIDTIYNANRAALTLKGTRINVTNHTSGTVSVASSGSTVTMKNWTGTKTINLKYKAPIVFQQDENYIHKFTKTGGSGSYSSVTPRYYHTIANSSLNLTVDTSTTWSLTQYAIILIPTSGYLFDVTVNNYDIVTDDIMNITVNSTISDNPSYINTTMKNASANYTVYVDTVSKGTVESDANGIASYQYSDLWGGTNKEIVFDWVSGGSVGSPSITAHTPSTPNSTTTDDTAIFTANADQTVNFTTWLNGSNIQTNNSVTSMSYTNTSGVVGIYNLTISIENTNGVDSFEWAWTVTTPWTPTANTTYFGCPTTFYTNFSQAWKTTQPQEGNTVITGWQVIPS